MTWYIDGSVVDLAFGDLATAAAAVVLVGSDGELVAFGEALLPASVRTSGAAEAHGLLLAVTMSVSPPRVVTDCLSLLDAARAWPAAVAANRPLAGVWSLIGAAMDGAARRLIDGGLLTWMPSHVARRNLGQRFRSDGAPVSTIDWRANRLVDAIARRCAFAGAAPRSVVASIDAASHAVAAVAATLGAVTRAANCHPVEQVTASGATVWTQRRDSVTVPPQPADAPKRPWRKRDPKPAAPPKPLSTTAPRVVSDPRSNSSRAAAAARRAAKTAAAAAFDHSVREVLSSRHAGATASSRDPYAKRQALLDRVKERLSGDPS